MNGSKVAVAETMRRAALTALSFLVMMSTGSGVAAAGTISWVDWLPGPLVSTTGLASGTLPGGIIVGYSGDVRPPTQTSDGAGINYWNPATPYLSATVSNAPPCCEIITLQGGTSTLAFSSPLLDPVMAIVSLGRTNEVVKYDFNQPFTLLSSGRGYWGGDPAGSLFAEPGDVLKGVEGHGVIQFQGLISSISWTTSVPPPDNNEPGEYWHGFQIGAVPDPASTLFLFGGAALGLLTMARRRKK